MSSSAAQVASASGASSRFADRLLAEALRLHEEDGRSPIDDPLAELHAQAVEGDLEEKIVVRARSAQIAGKLREALRQVRAMIGWMVLLGLVIAFIIGAAAARATLGTAANGVVNFYWVLVGILGVQTIALLVWLIVMLIAVSRRSKREGAEAIEPAAMISLGAAVIGLARWLSARVSRDAHQFAAISAAARVYSSGALGRWTFSSITHGLWLSFNIGCMSFIFILLAARDYTFVWETTILRSDHYVSMTRAIAWLPDRLGIATPSREQIEASQWPPAAPDAHPPHESREAWAGLLVGSIVVYGFAPRILLVGLSLGRRRKERSRYRLDVSLPGYARLESRLMPRTVSIGKVSEDGEVTDAAAATAHRAVADRPVTSSHAILGLEIDRPQRGASAWPPTMHGVHWDDFGIIEDRNDQHAALERLESSPAQPASLVVVCALTSTPDRGMMRFVREASERITQPVILVLTGGQSLRDRGYSADEVGERVRDWREAARQVGLNENRIVELDLEHLTDDGRQRIKRVLSGEQHDSAVHRRHIEQAFALIADAANRWSRASSPPSLESQAELHRQIARLYSSEQDSWRSFLGAPSSIKEDIVKHVRENASRVQSLLPDRLLRSPRWMAAGALAGALGCIAAATLISPVAIGALPMWSGIGGAIGALASIRTGDREASSSEGESQADCGDAVRAVVLFAMLLELQGRDEATITQILDDAIGPEDEPHLESIESVEPWLDEVRHRFDMSITGAGT